MTIDLKKYDGRYVGIFKYDLTMIIGKLCIIGERVIVNGCARPLGDWRNKYRSLLMSYLDTYADTLNRLEQFIIDERSVETIVDMTELIYRTIPEWHRDTLEATKSLKNREYLLPRWTENIMKIKKDIEQLKRG